MDSSWTDFELLDVWNKFFQENGYTIPKMIGKWERMYLAGKTEFGKIEDSNSNSESLKVTFNSEFGVKKVEGMG